MRFNKCEMLLQPRTGLPMALLFETKARNQSKHKPANSKKIK